MRILLTFYIGAYLNRPHSVNNHLRIFQLCVQAPVLKYLHITYGYVSDRIQSSGRPFLRKITDTRQLEFLSLVSFDHQNYP